MVLLANMHLIKGTLIIFSCGLAGYRAIPMVHWYQWYDWYLKKQILLIFILFIIGLYSDESRCKQRYFCSLATT